jgi:hypothetical protein
MFAADKLAHFLAGMMVFFTVALPGEPKRDGWWQLTPIAAVSVVAVGKELYDNNHPDAHTADMNDALATVAGGLTAWGIQELYRIRFHH